MKERSIETAPGLPGAVSLLDNLNDRVVVCRACDRLVEWRERVGREKRRSYMADDYWARPVPGFGDPNARLLILGLAPAAHGANRTGRVFTGDRSGDWLYAALHRANFANQPNSDHAADGLELTDAFVTAAVKCAPPDNKPSIQERDCCQPFLLDEMKVLRHARVILCLGSFAWEQGLRALASSGYTIPKPKPKFGHGSEAEIGPYVLVGSYHPSQQNTFTGRLTEEMLDSVLAQARQAMVRR